MLTHIQKIHLVKQINKHKGVLFARSNPCVSKRDKCDIWEKIRQELMDMGADVKEYSHLRDNEWPNMKRAALKRLNDAVRDGVPFVPKSVLDEIALEVVGPAAVNVKLQANSELSDSFNSLPFSGHSSPYLAAAGHLSEAHATELPEDDDDDDEEAPDIDCSTMLQCSLETGKSEITGLNLVESDSRTRVASGSRSSSRRRFRPGPSSDEPAAASLVDLKRHRLELENTLLELDVELAQARVANAALERKKMELEIEERRESLHKIKEESVLVKLRQKELQHRLEMQNPDDQRPPSKRMKFEETNGDARKSTGKD